MYTIIPLCLIKKLIYFLNREPWLPLYQNKLWTIGIHHSLHKCIWKWLGQWKGRVTQLAMLKVHPNVFKSLCYKTYNFNKLTVTILFVLYNIRKESSSQRTAKYNGLSQIQNCLSRVQNEKEKTASSWQQNQERL